ncbi:MAG: hypothetical protein COA42_24545 [Alteromonadaceae bacterium]|nr:MAG: hypothetical protein COA42_24545 [Alteromonadaceae bacterium]
MQPTVLFDSVQELLPHTAPMMLLTEVLAWGNDFVEVLVDHNEPSIFSDQSGDVPIWVGIEYMAQAMMVFAGIQAKLRSDTIKIGFLLGAHQYKAYAPEFKFGTRALIKAELVFQEPDGVALFRCKIFDGNTLLAESEVKGFLPDNPDQLLGALR